MKLCFTTILLLAFSCLANALDLEGKPNSFKYHACYQAHNEVQKVLDSKKFKAQSNKVKSEFFKAAVKSYMAEKSITKAQASKIVSKPIEGISAMNFLEAANLVDSNCDPAQFVDQTSSNKSNSGEVEGNKSAESKKNNFSEGETVFIHLREYRGDYYAAATIEKIAGEKAKVNIDDICSDVGCGYNLSYSEYDVNHIYWVYKSDLMRSRPF